MEADQDLNGIKLWQYMIQIYMHDGNKAIRIQRLESIISVKYTPNYPGGIDKWVLSYDNAFAELVLLEQRQWNLDSTKKNRILANAKAMDIDHTLLRQITRDMTYGQTCQIFRSHAIDKRYNSDSSSKTYKIHHTNTELATALLTRIEPEIWAKLPQDIKSLVIEKRKKEAEESLKVMTLLVNLLVQRLFLISIPRLTWSLSSLWMSVMVKKVLMKIMLLGIMTL